MNTRHHHNSASRAARPARAFTLVELLVAVGAVLLLSVGVGQVFRQVSTLVSTGTAAAEIDQLARAFERQLADDLTALSRMPAQDTFVVVRGRWLGDINNNGQLDESDGERAMYLTPDDREADARAGIQPYAPGSRAVTVRADEVCFLVDGQSYRTAQLDPLGSADVSATAARIYYGHALRAHSELDFVQTGQDNQDTSIYLREYHPDGDFGQRAGENNPFGGHEVSDDARNEYAGRFLLVRQPLLLAGSTAAGYPGSNPPPPFIGSHRAYAPYIRDLETSDRFNVGSDESQDRPQRPSSAVGGASINPDIGFILGGRVDICAQSPTDIRRWLEGADPANNTGVSRDASPFRAPGAWDGVTGFDDPLWQRFVINNNSRRTVLENNKALRRAVAGCMTRILADNQLPPVIRNRADSDEDPEDALMDLHAVTAPRCSSFEIAWSDGTTLTRNDPLRLRRGPGGLAVEVPNANDPADVTYRTGDIVWFDAFMPRSYYYRNFANPTLPAPFPDCEAVNAFGEPDLDTGLYSSTAPAAIYDPVTTAGTPISNAPDEYLSVWPFREIDGSGNIGRPWTKPRMIRVRVTLHDQAAQIKGGKTFEFIFNIGPEL